MLNNEIVNPFLDRGPIREPGLFFGRKNQVRKLVQAIGAQVPQSCSLVGERRIGKTSLLNYLAAPGGALQAFSGLLSRPADDYLLIRTDLSALKTRELNGALFFFRLIFRHLHRAALQKCAETGRPADGLAQIFNDWIDQTSLQELIEFGLNAYLDEICRLAPGWAILFLFDEADPMVRQGVGSLLRRLIQDRPVGYVLATRRPLEMIDPEREVSPLYNIMAETLALDLLAPADARYMAAEMAAQAGQPFTDEELDLILTLGGSHPDFTKVAARRTFEARLEGRPFDPAALTEQIAIDLSPVCQSLWEGLTAKEQELVSQAADGQPASDSVLAQRLTRRAILNETGQLFSPVFAAFVERKSKDAGAALPQAVRFGDGYVARGNQVVMLSPLEQKLLTYLTDHSGQVCTREELHQAVWGEDYTREDEVKINITIQRLRQRLDKLMIGEKIESVRGLGYRYVG